MPKVQEQLNLDHLRFDEKLHGAYLASFNRRALAYGLDLAIIAAASAVMEYMVVGLFLVLVITKKFRPNLRRAAVMVRSQLRQLDIRLADYEIEEKLRHQFQRHMRIYLYVLIWAPVVFAIALILITLVRWFTPHDAVTFVEANVGNSFTGFFRERFAEANQLKTIFTGFLGGFLYFSILTYKWQGQTIGKRLFKLRVVKLNGKPLTFWQSVERFTGYSASAFLLMGYFQYFWDHAHQTTHDKIAETVVVQE
ncbi:RDD family protein [Catalinimonas alkaloidigena]|uniref:RDD family protein n=1 Tax=Catalinimonas alkaloidigena TaxID=1075417 RepID=A0A1G9JG34_9BACT|nr:RDD family protein [Catalinimonas alkaloidigena]SDL36351.1 RDD family protein [Catalinimonas alkaloidigena]